MYVKYGDYQHQGGEAAVTISRDAVLSEQRAPIAVKERWDIYGWMHADTSAGLTTNLKALEAAYAKHQQDIGLYLDNGAITVHEMKTADYDTRVIKSVSYPKGKGYQYGTYRDYSLAVEGEKPDTDWELVSWQEQISWIGNTGPVWGYLPVINGEPQKQLFRQQSTQRTIQTGVAVGNDVYPLPPMPIWPDYEHTDQRQVQFILPTDGSLQRRTTWTFTFEYIAPMLGYPTRRALG